MPRYEQPQYERMTPAEIHDYIHTDHGDQYPDFPDPHGWTDAIATVSTAAEARHRAVRDDDSWVFAKVSEDVFGVVEFLRDRDLQMEWTAVQFARIGVGDADGDTALADVVADYLRWRDEG
ncbi:hypothetical protein ACFV1W_14185 [Kitasatospora sp. NPDC059648]|uniref:hypothetical protein n=1 Tax=Kitasatospora sp. NPDC059648 TaxID=3346894 RepID=UPI0036A0D726